LGKILIVIFILKIGNLVQKRFRKVQEYFASISDRIQENIYGIRVIKAYDETIGKAVNEVGKL